MARSVEPFRAESRDPGPGLRAGTTKANKAKPGIGGLNALSPEELTRRLSGPREEVAAFVRQAAEAGSAEAQARFGQMLLDGDGVPRDAPQAFTWFERAARAGHLEAANMVGRCYDLGWGVPVDKARAAAWFRQAAGRGLTWAKYNYATLLALGEGVAEDKAAALALFEEAANEGNAKAHNFVGSFHEDGWAVERDLDEAARRYRQAAEGGDFRGQFNYGRMLARQGKTADAAHWMRLAWQNGNLRFRAQMTDYLVGQGEPLDSAARALQGVAA
jgi:TPR repeat protein